MKGRDLILGALVGAAAGVLLAPDSGANTRKRIKDESDRLAKQTKKKAKELTDSLTATVEDLKSKAMEKGDALKSVAQSVKGESKEKYDELKTA